jgi:hypothetical protein
LILREGRRSILNAPYLDQFGEPDPFLKRGKNLFLNISNINDFTDSFILNNFDQNTSILSKTSISDNFKL